MAKKKRQDFKKLKIKAGKKIPKHLNETKPEFTAKKIQVKPFSKSSPSDLVKLLSSASLNSNLKVVYLGKLHQQLSQAPESSQGGEQIKTVCKFITDDDSRVRQQAIGCLKACIKAISQKSSPETLSPLLSIVLTFVNCGITHINESIRKDAQKFFAYLLDMCDASLENDIMQMFLSKITTLWLKSLDVDYYSILEKFVAKMSKKQPQRADQTGEGEQQQQNALVLKWSPTDCALQLHDSQRLARRYGNFQDFQLTFPNKAHTNVKDKFVEAVKLMAVKDAKSLIGKDAERILNFNEGQKAVSAMKILLSMHLHEELLEFWKHNPKAIPYVKISNPNTTKSSLKLEAKRTNHIQNEISFCLKRFEKLLKQ